VVHPRGARHMIDPSALYQGALAVYGAAEMARSYGSLVAVEAARVRASHDAMNLVLGGDRVLHLIDTPGHARHHHCIWDVASRGWFTGDTFGSSYREFDTAHGAWAFPNTVPVQLDPPALRASVARLMSFDPACVYATHYSRLTDVPRLAMRVLALLDDMVALAEQHAGTLDRHAALVRALTVLYTRSLVEHGVPGVPEKLPLLTMDIDLNAQGLDTWLGRPPGSGVQTPP